MKSRTKRFYNNINAKKLKSLEELVTAIAAMHNIIRAGREVIPVMNIYCSDIPELVEDG